MNAFIALVTRISDSRTDSFSKCFVFRWYCCSQNLPTFPGTKRRPRARSPLPLYAGRGFLVLVQVTLEGEGLAALEAEERLLLGVGLHVGSKVGLVGKSLAANSALERFFPCGKIKYILWVLEDRGIVK